MDFGDFAFDRPVISCISLNTLPDAGAYNNQTKLVESLKRRHLVSSPTGLLLAMKTYSIYKSLKIPAE